MQGFISLHSHFFIRKLRQTEKTSKHNFTSYVSEKIIIHKIGLNSRDSDSIYPKNGNLSRNKKKKTVYYTYLCFIFSILGCIETFYLTISKLNDSLLLCSDQNCSIVLNSAFSSFLTIPLSFFGFFLYFSLGAKLFYFVKTGDNKKMEKFPIRFSIPFFSLVLSLFSTYFIYILEQILKTSCPWCFFSIFLSGSLLIFLTIISSGDENINSRSSFSLILLFGLLIFSINSLNIIEVQNF